MRTLKTAKGTELPLMDLKGKDYLPVAQRIRWFREEHPQGKIETQLESNDKISYFKAFIFDKEGHLLSTAYKSLMNITKPNDFEKSETGAIGRALGLCGYGTQFGDDFEEGESLADSPVANNTQGEQPQNPFNDSDDEWRAAQEAKLVRAKALAASGKVVDEAKQGPVNYAPQKDGCISTAQLKRLYAIAYKSKWSNELIYKQLASSWKYQDPKDINWKDYEKICSFFKDQEPSGEEIPF